jgi:hypothetical protein
LTKLDNRLAQSHKPSIWQKLDADKRRRQAVGRRCPPAKTAGAWLEADHATSVARVRYGESLVVYAIELNPLDPVVPSISLRRATQRCVAPSVQRASGVSARRAHIRVRILLERRLASESGRPRGVIGLAKPLVLMNAARASDVGGHLSRMGGME